MVTVAESVISVVEAGVPRPLFKRGIVDGTVSDLKSRTIANLETNKTFRELDGNVIRFQVLSLLNTYKICSTIKILSHY